MALHAHAFRTLDEGDVFIYEYRVYRKTAPDLARVVRDETGKEPSCPMFVPFTDEQQIQTLAPPGV
ncbi:hypothetical protein [Planctomycetes bacterium K23_9]|uniref:Uncharacterized protein n=1 Tax=Stieleria marina TaxID=1930275 RepID=A0A517NW12_9BACT|nr:hypothetical protein K239x_33200 [Planctomycetes bacterium K23_9]